jgi:hypothetical protein
LGQLCKYGCTATITDQSIKIFFNEKIIMTATRSDDTTLWHLDTPNTSAIQHQVNATIGSNKVKDIVEFYHAAMFSPSHDTLYKALQKGYITNIPGFTASTYKKYLPFSSATIKGHQDQRRKNVRSTKRQPTN